MCGWRRSRRVREKQEKKKKVGRETGRPLLRGKKKKRGRGICSPNVARKHN